ncbi:hypothetical protein FRZ67_19280 [Panacibacter ginsenosidivorans]|uniref:Uncharacterized protein n=1 Tax=Panacibacter ginsenosidivorans TaxID=1813871 RepID=A0A5B8VE78_9BACT|nr:hypothetical protein [Panacibacter ginsenosidivorans]QEC69345.1 hypothetical protein FRZ67_19280 [Panacibacter ginsenosidivorans]
MHDQSTSDIITFRNDGTHYPFFQFTLAALQAIFFGDALHPVVESIPHGFDLEAHNELVEKFTAESFVSNDKTGLTLTQLMYLMSAIDKIGKILVGEDAVHVKSMMVQQMPTLSDDWDKDFLKGVQIMFQTFEEMFKDYPEYNEMLKMITGL